MAIVQDFRQQWASPTADAIRRAMDRAGVTLEHLSEIQASDARLIEDFLNSDRAMTVGLARALSENLGSSPSFWLNRDARFRQQREGLVVECLRSSVDLRSTNWLRDALRSLEDSVQFDLREAIGQVPTEPWARTREVLLGAAHLRSTSAHATNDDALALWMLRCEHVASVAPMALDREALRRSVPRLRRSSRMPRIEDALELVESVLRECGISLAVVQAPAGCPVSGATWQARDGRRIIAVSGRYLSDDHLFFTLMHEIGHVLLHSTEGAFVDELDPEHDGDRDSRETEADLFAGAALCSDAIRAEVESSRATYRDLIAVAARHGVSAGVVVGQLQRAGLIGFDKRNRLKRNYQWSGLSLRSSGRS